MGINEFNDSGDSPETARPRVSIETHLLIKEFSKQSGKGVRESYDEILQAVLKNEELLHDVLAEENEPPVDLTDTHREALNELAQLIKEYGRMPSMEEMNGEDISHGYPVYIRLFGSIEHIKHLLSKHDHEAYKLVA